MKTLFTFALLLFPLLPLLASAPAEARQPPRDYEEAKIIILGDTYSSGYQLDRQDTYAIELRRRLNARHSKVRIEVINASIEGGTAANAVSHLQSILAQKPDMVIVALGGTDALHNIAPALTKRALDQILNVLTHNNIYVLVVGFKAPEDAPLDYAARYNQIHPSLAKRYGVSLVPDLLRDVREDPLLRLYDSDFPNEDGMQAIANMLFPIVHRMFGKLKI